MSETRTDKGTPKRSLEFYGSVIAWRRGPLDPRDVEFLVVDRYEDGTPSRVGETLEARLIRVQDKEKRLKKTKFPGGIFINNDATAEVSDRAREVFAKQGLPVCMSATLKRVFNRQTGLALLKAHPEPVHRLKVKKKTGDSRKCFFITGPNDDGTDWCGYLRKELTLIGHNGGPAEILLPPRWVSYRELCGTIFYTNRTALQLALKEIFKHEDELFDGPVRDAEMAPDDQAVGTLP